MSTLNSNNIKLLNKVFNLCSDDSVILEAMDKERDKNVESLDKTNEVKKELQQKIESLTEDESKIRTEGNDLVFALTSLCQNDYSFVLKSLGLRFDANRLLADLSSKLPSKLETVNNEIKMNNNELNRVEDKISELVTRIEELKIRKEEALADQKNLNRYVELALNNEINVTREELTGLFNKFDFNEKDQKELAKMFMFPEDGLIEYSQANNNKQDKKENYVDNPIFNEVNIEYPSLDEMIEKQNNANDQLFESINMDYSKLDDIIDEFVINENIQNDNTSTDNAVVKEESDEIVFEPITFDPTLSTVIPSEEVKKETISKEVVVNKLKSLGFDELDFASNDVEIISNNYDEELIEKNVKLINDMSISKDVFFDNVELLFDKELADKISSLTNVGKMPKDIYLYPTVLTKYSLNELDSAINILKESGLEPKNVPLMAY